jgi:hypothetical protein
MNNEKCSRGKQYCSLFIFNLFFLSVCFPLFREAEFGIPPSTMKYELCTMNYAL